MLEKAASARQLPASPLSRPLPIFTTASLVLGLVLDRHMLRCDMANDENATYIQPCPAKERAQEFAGAGSK
jgi:hypothetical protein